MPQINADSGTLVMKILKNRNRFLIRSSVSSMAVLLFGCSSLDPFANPTSFEARINDYPTLRAATASSEPTEQPRGNIEQVALTKPVQRRPAPQIFRGTSPSTGNVAGVSNTDSLLLNFENATIAEAASLIFGDFLGAPFEVDPSVTGSINLRSAAPLSADAALRAFETVLRQNKAAFVNDNGLYRVVPEQQALGFAAAPQIGTGRSIRPGYGVQIAPLEFVDAAEMAEILRPLAAADSVIRIDAERNLLLLAGSSSELSLWLETIQTFDIDWFDGKSVGIFPLQQVSATTMIKELESIFQTSASSTNETIRFLPIERTNSVMAITRAAPLLDKVRSWTSRLDADSGAARRLRVYPMKNAQASEVAPLLQEIFGAPSESVSRQPVVVPGQTPTTVESEGLVSVSTATPPPTRLSAGSVSAAGANASLRIIPDEAANTLLMLATQDEYTRIEEALRQLDVAPLQVLVEATIVEVTITDDLRYGVQYFLEGSLGQESAVAALSNAASQSILPTLPGFSLIVGEPSQIILDALENITDLNVISSPNLMVLDNQTARLVVGDQIPVTVQNVTNGFTSDSDDPVLFNSIEFRDTGVIFEVTPRISSNGAVTLDIVQEVSTVGTTAAATLTPTISQRRIESSVAAQSGQTIVLGGLFSDLATRGRSGIPIVSRAPLFGGLFSNTSKVQERTELVVLIQPRILRNNADAQAITREFQDRVTGLQLLSSGDRPAPLPTSVTKEPTYAPAWPATPNPQTKIPTTETAFAPAQEINAVPSLKPNAIARNTRPVEPEPIEEPLIVLQQPDLRVAEAHPLPIEEQAKGFELKSVLPVTKASTGGSHFVQLGTFEKERNAHIVAREIKEQDQSLANTAITTKKDRGLWRLLAGPYNESTARDLCDDLERPCAVVSE